MVPLHHSAMVKYVKWSMKLQEKFARYITFPNSHAGFVNFQTNQFTTQRYQGQNISVDV